MINQIKSIRKEKGITQRELANKAEISAPYLFDLENNRRGAKPETLERIAAALGVTTVELIEKKAG